MYFVIVCSLASMLVLCVSREARKLLFSSDRQSVGLGGVQAAARSGLFPQSSVIVFLEKIKSEKNNTPPYGFMQIESQRMEHVRELRPDAREGADS